MSKDIAFFSAVILAVALGAFAGSAFAIHVFKEDQTAQMQSLRSEAEPSVCKLFQSAAR